MDTDFFKAKLLERREQLQTLTQSSAGDSATVELDQSKFGRLSRMDALQSQQMAKETARRREQELTKIETALRRIENGEYGKCFVCGELISEARLKADPTCTRCIECAELRSK